MNTHYKEMIRSDLFRYYGKTDLRTFLAVFYNIPGFRFTYFLRKCQYYRTRPGLISKLLRCFNLLFLHHYRLKFGFELADITPIGKGLYIGHFGSGFAIRTDAIIGHNVNIATGVTIGQAIRGKRAGAPTIGNGVWIGTHAVIVGKVKIGDNALIGPGAYVNFDVPENAVVIGNPGQIISYSGTAGYVENRVAFESEVAPLAESAV